MESGGVYVEDDGADLGFSKWIQNIKGKPGLSFNTYSDPFLSYIGFVFKCRALIQLHIQMNYITFLDRKIDGWFSQ